MTFRLLDCLRRNLLQRLCASCAILAAVLVAELLSPRVVVAMENRENSPPDFKAEILPILRRNCFECHGEQLQEGDLRLDQREAVREHATAIVAGDAASSELYRRVTLAPDDPEIMPATGKSLSKSDTELLRRWIEAGAEWPADAVVGKHWAYVAPVRPALAEVNETSWIRNGIDHFVLHRLGNESLKPSPEADRVTLIRRVTLDLIGLPPTPEEVDAYIEDDGADAYEKVVERLLASPQFGERWARPWLDLARYADSYGYQRDDLWAIWAYRDWVIRALNADMPFDKFTIEQLAGDLLANATEEQRIATGFHRCAMTNVEAGSNPEETRVNQVLDRVNTTATVWLGTTLECAQCHDHKYDPFSQKEYFQLFAFFNNTAIEAEREKPNVPGSIQFIGPTMPLSGAPADGKARTNADEASTLIMQELRKPRTTNVFIRGDFKQLGDVVTPNTPAVLHTCNEENLDRLSLAEWLVDRKNPLVARVTVNRWWAEIFGRGIVETSEDFGIKGAPPTHPELLDWLAVEFMENGWSRKRLLRTIVTSATYRQSSHVTPDALARDPENELYARGPRFRMDAEMVRDNALAVSGLLSKKQFGPPIRPFQPAGLWAKVGGKAVKYKTSKTPDRYRRGIYVIIKRASLYPSFANFDASARLTCTVKRSRSNTPLQALTLLNDPVFVEAAHALAARTLNELPDGSPLERLNRMVRTCLCREPSEAERESLLRLYEDQLQSAREHPEAARQLTSRTTAADGIAADELAAWYAVATVLLNLDETITKG